MATIEEHLEEIEGVIDQMTVDGHGSEDFRIMAGINAIACGVRSARKAAEDVEKEKSE